ncbi:pirin family protein [Ekhidna sp.]|uniref:pirin family protein n=1 Tax=Ekhidna sp. TaxID=2608089 RepID=UPI003CCBE1C0
MKKVIHKADTRGEANFGWLNSRHTFSFGQYYNPDRIQFGLLRVLNDDIVIGGAGFPTHPHDNMEIISIPLKGALAHRDSTGTEKVINTGEVQIMSAGSGLTHSEYNASKNDEVNFLQIWVFPKEKDIKPRYDQKEFHASERKDRFQTVVSPSDDHALWINQDAYFSLADLASGNTIEYTTNQHGNGVYIFVLEGQIEVADSTLSRRDAIGISDAELISISAAEDTELLVIEVPMN